MPVTKQAIKKVRQDRRKTVFNLRVKRALKKAIADFRKNPTAAGLKLVYKVADKAAKNNVIHKNKASRIKARLSKLVKSSARTAQTKKTTKASVKK